MKTIYDLPQEVVMQVILSEHCISIGDLKSVMLSLFYLKEAIVRNNGLWKKKFYLRWPRMVVNLELGVKVSWYELCISREKIELDVGAMVGNSSRNYYPIGQPSFSMLNELIVHSSFYRNSVEDELTSMVFHGGCAGDMTLLYYAKAYLEYARRKTFEEKWKKLGITQTSSNVLFEAAVLMGQSFTLENENVWKVESDIDFFFTEICDKVSVFYWKEENKELPSALNNNAEGTVTARNKILNLIARVLFKEMNLQARSYLFCYLEESINMFDVGKIVEDKKGHSSMFLLLFREVAKRLGINTEMIIFDKILYTRYREYCSESKQVFTSCRRIPSENDEFEELRRPTVDILNNLPIATDLDVIGLLIDKIIHLNYLAVQSRGKKRTSVLFSLKFMRSICVMFAGRFMVTASRTRHHRLRLIPRTRSCSSVYANLCLTSQIAVEDGLRFLEVSPVLSVFDVQLKFACLKKLEEEKDAISNGQIWMRDSAIKYAVGSVMIYDSSTFTTDGGDHSEICVIVSWSRTCDVDCLGRDAGGNAGVEKPFYYVLTNTNLRYVSEETLRIFPHGHGENELMMPVNHFQLGLHFCSYNGCRFIMNSEKNKAFPEDDKFAEIQMNLCYKNEEDE